MTRYQIAQATGIENSALSRFISGERGLTTASLDKLAEVLELRLETQDERRGRDLGRQWATDVEPKELGRLARNWRRKSKKSRKQHDSLRGPDDLGLTPWSIIVDLVQAADSDSFTAEWGEPNATRAFARGFLYGALDVSDDRELKD